MLTRAVEKLKTLDRNQIATLPDYTTVQEMPKRLSMTMRYLSQDDEEKYRKYYTKSLEVIVIFLCKTLSCGRFSTFFLF